MFQVDTQYNIHCSNTLTLTVPRITSETYGDRTFLLAGPELCDCGVSPSLAQLKVMSIDPFFKMAIVLQIKNSIGRDVGIKSVHQSIYKDLCSYF